MGVSTDATLFWGIDLGEEIELHDHTNEFDLYEFNEQWQKAHAPASPEPTDYDSAEYAAYRKAYAGWRKSSENIAIDTHCSDSYPMYYVAVDRHTRHAGRGDLTSVDPRKMVSTYLDKQMLLKFLAEAGIKYEGEPGWLLCSYWG